MTRRATPALIDRDEQAFRESEFETRPRWTRGEVVPAQITLLLDARQLYGPDVDRACGAVEPAVDEWETGERYPTWPQLLALARLTDALPGFFFRPAVHVTGPIFICSRGRGKSQVLHPAPPVAAYPEHVWRPVVDGVTDTLFDLPPTAYRPTEGAR